MALSKFKRTSAGTNVASQYKKTPAIQNDNSQAQMLAAIDRASAKKQQREEQEYMNNLKEGLLTGKMNETSYYTSIANFYEEKMNSSKSKFDKQEYRIRMLTAQESSRNAAKAEASAARSQSEKAASAKYSDFKANISIAYSLVQTKLENGGYANPSEYFAAKKEIYDQTMEGLGEVVSNPAFSDSMKRTAEKDIQLYKMQADNKYAGGEFGAVNYVDRNDDDYVFMQKDDGSIAVDEKPWFKDQTQALDTNGQQYVKSASGTWLQLRKLVQTDPLTGVQYFFDPAKGGAPVKVDPQTEPEQLKYMQNAFGVYVKDPQSDGVKLWITNDELDSADGGIQTNNKWHVFGDNQNFLDQPAYGLNVVNDPAPSAFKLQETPGFEDPLKGMSVGPGYKLTPGFGGEEQQMSRDEPTFNFKDIAMPQFKPQNEVKVPEQQSQVSPFEQQNIPQFLSGVGDLAKGGFNKFKSFFNNF